MKAIIISEKKHFLPWAADSGVNTCGLLLPEADNLFFRIENIDGTIQLLVFPQHEQRERSEKITVFEIPEKKAKELIDLAKKILDTTTYLGLNTPLGQTQ